MKHIVISGKRRTGKTELLEKLLRNYDGPVYGFYTDHGKCMKPGYRSYFMYRFGEDRVDCEENHIGDSVAGEGSFCIDTFNIYGVKCLEAEADGIVVMDEIGFMEAEAERFAEKVLELLDGDIPVIAVTKAGHDDVELLNKIRNHPKVELFGLDENNTADDVFGQIKEKCRDFSELLSLE